MKTDYRLYKKILDYSVDLLSDQCLHIYYVADVKKLNPYLFPATEKIVTAFMSNKHEMLTNMFASFRIADPICDHFSGGSSCAWYNHGNE